MTNKAAPSGLRAKRLIEHNDFSRSACASEFPGNFSNRGEVMVKLKVNGTERTFDGDATMPLLWFLRDELRLTGTKFGCGMALCGACTVHKDGKAVRACSVPMSEVAGAEITTIEGLGANGLHPVQKAWIRINVPQCGYCQPGQMMQAAAFLETKKKPTDADIDAAMSGNICRCGTYHRVRAAIKSAAEELA
jgi:isoquinoline 1-oxidoreductase alpha subunit